MSAPPAIGYYLQIVGSNFVVTDTAGSAVYSSNNALSAITDIVNRSIAASKSGYIRTGTYPTSGTILMKSNTHLVTQNGVNIQHTGGNEPIIKFMNVSNASMFAEGTLDINGRGLAGYDLEFGLYFDGDNDKISIESAINRGFILRHLGHGSTGMPGHVVHLTNSLFKNIHTYDWSRHGLYPAGGFQFDGLTNVTFDNCVSDGLDMTTSRSAIVVGGQNAPSSYVYFLGGLYANAYADNGIYLGGWQQPVHHLWLTNVTTSGNNKARTAHSGLKIRPASYVTVRGWHSIGDYQGCEMGTCYDSVEGSTYNTGGSWYNSIEGVIDNPVNVGLIVGTDGSDKGQSNQHNEFFLTINNSGKQSVWWYNGGVATGVSNNMLRLVSNGAQRQALSLEGTINNNVFYGIFANNGKAGYPDITLAGSGNTVNVVSTTGNPNGLYTGSGGTVVYPYTGTVPPVPLGNPTLTVHTTPEGVPFTVRRVA